MRAASWITLIATLTHALLGCGEPARAPTLVFAAASLRPVVDEALAELSGDRGPGYRVSYAGSSTLARQIDAGAPADLFLSANEDWIRWLRARGHLAGDEIVTLSSNRLVLIAPRDRPFSWRPGQPLDGAFSGTLALAEPSHVPAGVYAREALERLGAWAALEPRVVGASDVRAALRFVAHGGAAAGIVYRTDALESELVLVVAELDPRLHAPIRYIGAPLRGGSTAAARRLLSWLSGPRGQAAFSRHGFTPPSPTARADDQEGAP